ncbi:MAG TPA: hypothetical protein VHZ55_10520 [Bryobacteraceae bacterium]|nr:hypothetical protein [Bryobacteraceae bacterium]
MDLLFALLAYSEVAFVHAVQSSSSVPQFFGFTIDVTDCKSTFRRALDFFHLIRALLNRNAITLADPLF